MGPTIHHREDRTMNDRDPRWAGGGLWAVILLVAIITLVVAYFAIVLGVIQ